MPGREAFHPMDAAGPDHLICPGWDAIARMSLYDVASAPCGGKVHGDNPSLARPAS